MARLLVNDEVVTVSLPAIEKAEAAHGDISVPRAAIVSARIAPDGMDEVHGLRMPGTGLPGVIVVGSWRDKERVTFAVCHGRRHAVVLELTSPAGHPSRSGPAAPRVSAVIKADHRPGVTGALRHKAGSVERRLSAP